MSATPEIRQLIDSFVADLEVQIREAIRARFDAAIGDAAARPKKGAAKASVAAKPAPVKVRKRKKGQKRAPEELVRIEAALLAFIRKNPGKRIEEINTPLGLSTGELARPMSKLVDAKKVRRKGQKRATRYFPRGT